MEEVRAVQLRQLPLIERLTGQVKGMHEFLGAILLGSFAAGRADALSDLDLLLVAREGKFSAAWTRRHDLHGAEMLVSWDVMREGVMEMGAHKWITPDVIMVECLIATPSSGVRLVGPFAVITGDARLPEMLTRRPPITRDELLVPIPSPGSEIESAYDEFKALVRNRRGRQLL